MGLRFRKSVKLGKGMRLNFSKSGVSMSAGGKGHRVTFGRRGVRATVGIPGTGISYSTQIGGKSQKRKKSRHSRQSAKSIGKKPDKTGVGIGGTSMEKQWNAHKSEKQPEKKRKTWLWVLGWILIFPLPLTILLLRNEKMDKRAKIAVLAVAWIGYFVVVLSGGSDRAQNADVDTATQANEVVTNDNSATAQEDIAEASASEKPEAVLIEGFEFNDMNDVTLKVDETISNGYVTVNVSSKKDFSPENVIFVSEDPKIATISLEQVKDSTRLYYEITGVSPGETNVYVMSEDRGVTSERIQVTVSTPVDVTSVDIQDIQAELYMGEQTTPKVTVLPDDAEEKTLAWKSSDESIATVDANGTVTAVGGGVATITATATNGVTASFEVTVSPETLMKLNITHPRQDENSIGDEWTYYTEINGESTTSTIGLTAGDQLSFYAEFTESDTNPDVGQASTSYTVTEDDIANGFVVKMDLYVTENGGRYSGKTAYFIVTFTFTPN